MENWLLSNVSVCQNDPVNFINIQNWTPELRNMVLKWGPCQPKDHEFHNGEYPQDEYKRRFHSSWYSRQLLDNTFINREWLTYSQKLNKMFCLSCILYGNNPTKAWVKDGLSYWKNGLMSIRQHETTSTHVMATLKIKLKKNTLPLLPSLIEKKNHQISFNREVVKQLIEITIFLARHNLLFRGHDEKWTSDLKGNFKDMVILLSQYSPMLSGHINNLKIKGKKENSFISWDRQNLLIESIAQYISSVIKSQILTARYFSICIDSTFDVSHREQLSFIVRYLFDGKIYERLIAIVESPYTTGQALFELFNKVMDNCNLDWKNNLVGQSYDGAANMRGTYNGLQAKIYNINTRAVYIWCYAHHLNLIVLSAVGSCKEAVNLFGNLEKLHTFISNSKKRSEMYRKKQQELYPKKQVRAIKRVGTTRWLSTSYALSTVLDTLEAIIYVLNIIKEQEGSSDFKTGSECSGLINYFQSSNFILTAFIFKQVFSIIEPLNKILQLHDLDLLAVIDILKITETRIEKLRSEKRFIDVYNEAKNYSENNFGDFEKDNLVFKNRKRKVPRRSGELAEDETISDPVHYFKISVFFLTIDIILLQIREKFQENCISILKDIGLLSIKRMNEVQITNIPKDAFKKICSLYGLDQESVQREYILFSQFIQDINLKKLQKLPEILHSYRESDSDVLEESEQELQNKTLKTQDYNNLKNIGSLKQLYEIFHSANLQPEFQNLFHIIKISLSIPISSCSVKRQTFLN